MTQAPILYHGMDRATLAREYDARGSVPSFDAEYARYLANSQAVHREHRRIADIVYDEASGETLDIYPAEPGAPLFLWIHGGYWRATSKDDNAFVVPGLTAQGFAVAVMNYTLAPQASLDEIVRQTRAALGFLHRERARYGFGGVSVGGSSAGGHLTAMLLAGGWHAAYGMPGDVIEVALDLSGLHELEPLRHIEVNSWLSLDDAMIDRNSPIRHIPSRSSTTLITAVGGLETSEFRRQTSAYATAWADAGHRGDTIAMPRHNHFDIALSLGERDSVLAANVAAALRQQSA
ncbi:Arylformamidase [Bosea sp. 62]|uniref:alpha/beta hydrolase n=1 Tax=unclassified Bosea (in: a-proteobacteria) TaxID=2653178 RepID=UPI0012531874|nr:MULTISPECIES: alpha/beta hydrolase [unclassified Bosea (in: a-proteobacteria)]CAD5256584.1 Arylformamidase [Bosea sp. 46]CAD5260871.1 Arylformamidase [Bosea sp. 21B]CAD5279771.1 Arylformamidase [Bosea sp. 7B]VVT58349.1 Arylformamidase [Bosea sp. EC-HK365B]VXB51670.1 Arylformamidase [Bosea sp. 29B]